MSMLALIAFLLRAGQVPWVDMAQEQIERVAVEQRIAAQRAAISARFTRTKAFALANVDETIDPLALTDRLAALREEGEDETAALVEQLQRQAEAEERWAEELARTNATTDLDPDAAPRPDDVPAAPAAPAPKYAPAPLPPKYVPPLLPVRPVPPLPPKQTASPKPSVPAKPSPAVRPPVPVATKGSTLTISKLGIKDAPVVETDILDQKTFLADLKRGIAHDFCNPGEPCKNVMFGHSSGFAGDTSPYKRIFSRLNELSVGDTVEATHDGKRYTYVVFKKEIVGPNSVQILRNYNYEELTLFTCWPINTWKQRLVVYTKRL